jgi:hypothetical protein
MTAQDLYSATVVHLIILTVVVVLTRPTTRRLVGALVGMAVCGGIALSVIGLGEATGWWHFTFTWEPQILQILDPGEQFWRRWHFTFTSEPYVLTLVWICFLPLALFFLLTWRIARRFGWRGLAVTVLTLAVLASLGDNGFPEWGTDGPALAPLLALSLARVLLMFVGHGIMCLIAGPASGSSLARRPWETAAAV